MLSSCKLLILEKCSVIVADETPFPFLTVQLLSVCIGSYLSGGLIYVVDVVTRALDPEGYGWLPKDLNKGHLDYFLALLGVLMLINCLLYAYVASYYEYKSIEHVQRVTPRPPRAPAAAAARPPSAPITSRGTSAAHATGARRESPTPALYGRSVTFMPPSPVMPAVRR